MGGTVRLAAAVALGVTIGSLAAGCSTSSVPSSVSGAPVLAVVTGLWPLAQAAAEIGGQKVAVDDLVPSGSDPFSYPPGAGGTRILQAAGLVIEVGGGAQPLLEQAARGAPRVLQLDRLGGADPYPWLDPATMGHVVAAITTAMATANPPAAPLYRRNAEAVQSEIQSLHIDYSSTLSTCPGHDIVTPDRAFGTMAADFGLTEHVIGATAGTSTVMALAAQLRPESSVGIVSEPWVDDRGVAQVAAALGVTARPVDTLAGAPVGGSGVQDTYMGRMEEVLGQLSAALGCAAEQ